MVFLLKPVANRWVVQPSLVTAVDNVDQLILDSNVIFQLCWSLDVDIVDHSIRDNIVVSTLLMVL
jgi:hypothetical protein